MRIINQSGTFDVPYEITALWMNTIHGEYVIHAQYIGQADFFRIAAYSTEEKAKNAMEMLRESYSPIRISKKVAEEINQFGVKLNPLDVVGFLNKDTRDDYFQFPPDKEIEV